MDMSLSVQQCSTFRQSTYDRRFVVQYTPIPSCHELRELLLISENMRMLSYYLKYGISFQ